MRSLLSICALVSLCVPAVASAATAKLETEDQKTLYALGLVLAERLAPFDLQPGEVDVIALAISDAVAGREPQVAVADYQAKIDGLAQARQSALASKEKGAAEAFLAAAAAQEGARSTDTGLIIVETTQGSGAQPAATDTVSVHYHGTLRDGSVFDSSRERGEPARFPLNRVIPCWTEALQLMRVGGRATITCPADIAYGDRGAPGGRIGPGAALQFDVELLEIEQP